MHDVLLQNAHTYTQTNNRKKKMNRVGAFRVANVQLPATQRRVPHFATALLARLNPARADKRVCVAYVGEVKN